MQNWQIAKQAEADFTEDRPVIAEHNNTYRVLRLLQAEVDELAPAICYYLLDKNEETKQNALQEAADVGIFLMALFRLLDADMLEEMMEKIAFNHVRFNAVDCQTGSWKKEVYPRLKRRSRREKTRERFYAKDD